MIEIKFLKRNLFQRVLGIPATSRPVDAECWSYSGGRLVIDLNRAAELKREGGALRLEGGSLPCRLLVIHGSNDEYRAVENRCSHLGHRRLDPVPGTATVQCCSVGKSTYGHDGRKIYGPAPRGIRTYPTHLDGDNLTVTVP
jgi:nitrite reductase/ring-hydroxylating ferredoxin subunit